MGNPGPLPLKRERSDCQDLNRSHGTFPRLPSRGVVVCAILTAKTLSHWSAKLSDCTLIPIVWLRPCRDINNETRFFTRSTFFSEELLRRSPSRWSQ